jgi:hypothetical protein
MFKDPLDKRVIITKHARGKMADRGVSEEEIREAIRIGRCEPAQRGLMQYRLNIEYRQLWGGKYYGMKQVLPVVAEADDRYVVVTVYSYYFHEGDQQ